MIPRTFHRVWLGHKSMPEPFRSWGDSWIDKHPGWQMTTWTRESFHGHTDILALLDRCPNYSQMSDVLRYEILRRHGGVYIDTDFECKKNIEPLIDGADAFAVWQLDDHYAEGAVAAGICGAVPGHPLFNDLVKWLPNQILERFRSIGPAYFTRHVHGRGVRILEREHFYPYSWTELHRQRETFPEAYAVHHWAGKWYPDSFMRRRPPP